MEGLDSLFFEGGGRLDVCVEGARKGVVSRNYGVVCLWDTKDGLLDWIHPVSWDMVWIVSTM